MPEFVPLNYNTCKKKKHFDVLGFVTPFSGMNLIKGTSMGKLRHLSQEDVVVLWGGIQ